MLQPQLPKAGTPAAAAPAAHEAQPSAPAQPQSPSMGFFGSPIFFLLLFLPFLFMMWRRNKRETDARSKMKKGDKVVVGGLLGEVVDIDERIAKVKIAAGVTVQALPQGLAPYEDPTKTQPAKDTSAKKEEAPSKS